MSTDRTQTIAGPAIVIFGGQTFYSEEDVTAKPTIQRFSIGNAVHGKADERHDHTVWDVEFTPAGQWLAGHLPVLWPYQNPTLFASMLGAVDKDIVIHSLAGRQLTFKAGCIMNVPEIILSAVKTPIGSVSMKAIGANDTPMSDEAKYLVDAAVAFADTSYDPDQIPTVPYTASWGASAPWNAIETEEGWSITGEVGVKEYFNDSDGLFDIKMTSVDYMAKCKPLSVSEAEVATLLKFQGAGVARGVSARANANDLVITGGSGNPKVTLYNASPKEAGYVFGSGDALRQGELGFVALRKFTAGAPGGLILVETAA